MFIEKYMNLENDFLEQKEVINKVLQNIDLLYKCLKLKYKEINYLKLEQKEIILNYNNKQITINPFKNNDEINILGRLFILVCYINFNDEIECFSKIFKPSIFNATLLIPICPYDNHILNINKLNKKIYIKKYVKKELIKLSVCYEIEKNENNEVNIYEMIKEEIKTNKLIECNKINKYEKYFNNKKKAKVEYILNLNEKIY